MIKDLEKARKPKKENVEMKAIVFCAVLSCGLLFSQPGFAQGYYEDENTDINDYIYVDMYAEAPQPASCDTSINVYSTFVGQSQGATSYYPDIASISQQSGTATEGTEYEWSREIDHNGLQRGGNCGVYLTSYLDWRLLIVHLTSVTSNVGSGSGVCNETLSCALASRVPVCPPNATSGNTTTFNIASDYCEAAYYSGALAYKKVSTDSPTCLNFPGAFSAPTTIYPGFCTYK